MNNLEPGYNSDSDQHSAQNRADSPGDRLNASDDAAQSNDPFALPNEVRSTDRRSSASEASFLQKSEAYSIGEGSNARPMTGEFRQASALQQAPASLPNAEDSEAMIAQMKLAPIMQPLDMSAPPGEASETAKKKKRALPLVAEALILLLVAILLTFGLQGYVTNVYEIRGDSMQPTLQDGQKVMISKLTESFDSIEVGDIIIFTDPQNPERHLIKRVIALPGQRVEVLATNEISVDGKKLDESYIHRGGFPRSWSHENEVVGKDQLWVMGDNRGNSKDSRTFGAINKETIQGRVILRLWPFDQINTF